VKIQRTGPKQDNYRGKDYIKNHGQEGSLKNQVVGCPELIYKQIKMGYKRTSTNPNESGAARHGIVSKIANLRISTRRAIAALEQRLRKDLDGG